MSPHDRRMHPSSRLEWAIILVCILPFDTLCLASDAKTDAGVANQENAVREQNVSLDVKQWNALMELAETQLMQHEFVKAENLARRALSIQQKVLGYDHVATFRAHLTIAIACGAQEKLNESEHEFKHALSVRQAANPGDDLVAAGIKVLLCRIFEQKNESNIERERLLREALSVQEKLSPRDDRVLSNTISALARVCKTNGKSKETESYILRALSLQEKMSNPDVSEMISNLQGLASIRFRDARYSDAEEILKRILKLKRQPKSYDSVELLDCIEALVECTYRQGKYQTSLEYLGLAIEIQTLAFGAKSSEVVRNKEKYRRIQNDIQEMRRIKSRSGS